jgi:ATP adenylyltransferase
MRYLWAPWRATYLKQVNKKVCFICRALKQKPDRTNLVVARSASAICLMNRYPYNTGHLMIAPLKHKARLEDLTPDEVIGLFDLLTRLKGQLDKVLKPDGFNIGMNLGRVAGAGLPGHLHIHLVPRWTGDTNFMPVLANTKIISRALDEVYRKLTEALKKEEHE